MSLNGHNHKATKQGFNIDPAILEIAEEMAALRRLLHSKPQTGFEENFAHEQITKLLKEWGVRYDVMAETGIVATLEGEQNTSSRTIGFRADMDALNIDTPEDSGVEWASIYPEKMHACGHDGHMASILAALKYLKDRRNFDGTLKFVFQPAEEGLGGAEKMINDGLFEHHKMDAIYGYHNWPWLPFGSAAIHEGPVMSANTRFYITFHGKSGHSGTPDAANNPVNLITNLQSDITNIRKTFADKFPDEKIVIEPTVINIGNTSTPNVISNKALLAGTIRTYSTEIIENIDTLMTTAFQEAASRYNMHSQANFKYTSAPTINDTLKAEISRKAMTAVIGKENTKCNEKPSMLSEDFGKYSITGGVKSSYIWIGSANPDNPEGPHSQPLHNSRYDFNDNIIPIVVQYVSNVVQEELPPASELEYHPS